MNRLLIVTAILALFSPGIYAQKYNPKFDEGLDLAEFIKAATEDPSFQTYMPFSPLESKVVEIISVKDAGLLGLRQGLLKPKAGSFHGDLRVLVTGNAAHIYAIKHLPPLQSSQDPAAKELLIQWENITNARVLLLDEAQVIELKDSGLYAKRTVLNNEAEALIQERNKLDIEIDAFQQTCNGQPPTNTDCVNWYNDLKRRATDWQNRNTTHNNNVYEWRSQKSELDSSVNDWRGKLKAWEQAILYFIEKAQAFLKDTGECTPQQHETLQTAVNDTCKVPNEPYACKQWNPNDPAKDCSEWRAIYQRNIDCYSARREINQTCYDGGNPTHQDEERIAAERADKCWLLIQESCLKAIAPSIPGRRYGGGF